MRLLLFTLVLQATAELGETTLHQVVKNCREMFNPTYCVQEWLTKMPETGKGNLLQKVVKLSLSKGVKRATKVISITCLSFMGIKFNSVGLTSPTQVLGRKVQGYFFEARTLG